MENNNNDFVHVCDCSDGEWLDKHSAPSEVDPNVSDETVIETVRGEWLMRHPGARTYLPDVQVVIFREDARGEFRKLFSGSPFLPA